MAARSGDCGKQDRKLTKKLYRIKDRLAKNENVIVCEEPSKIVCVQNGGLDNGVCQDEVLGVCFPFGAVEEIIMIPKKPFCFVCFDSPDSAARAKERLTGHVLREGKDPSQNVTLFLFFVSSAPSSVCPSSERPPGLLLFEDFISMETEDQLLKTVNFETQEDAATGATDSSAGSSLKHRAVQHFGFEFKYGINNVDPKEPLSEGIPAVCRDFLQRAIDTSVVKHFPDQLTVNRYLPGQGIPSHVDTPSAFEDGIMSLSCGSQVIMDFRHPDGRHLSVLLPSRSLLVMTGESRYVWSHGITPRKSDIVPAATGGITLTARGTRTSFTFRKLSATAGILSEEEKDSFSCMPKTNKEASVLESQHVHSVYEEIADHFSDTRHKPWPQIAEFLTTKQPGSILVDTGCGNGKYFGVNPQLCQIGSDRSEKLAGICVSRGFQVFVCDVLAIPVRSHSVDVGLCIAVVHHLSTQERRRQAIMELVRILRPGGSVLIYVWAQEQEKDKEKSKYLKANKDRHTRAKQTENEEQTSGVSPKDKKYVANVLQQSVEVQSAAVKMTTNENESLVAAENQSPSVTLEPGLPRGDTSPTEVTARQVNGDNCACSSTSRLSDHKTKDSSSSSHLNECKDGCPSSPSDSKGDSLSATDIQPLKIHVNRTEFKDQDMLVPWQLKTARTREEQKGEGDAKTGERQTFHRYYHMFRQGELDALCAEVPDCTVKRSYYDQGNWCVVLEKK